MALAEADMTVQEMADEFGMSRTSLSRWLNDRGAPPRTVFIKQWALRTGVSYQWLVTGEVGNPDDGPGLPWPDSNGQPSGNTSPQVIAVIPMPRRTVRDLRRAA